MSIRQPPPWFKDPKVLVYFATIIGLGGGANVTLVKIEKSVDKLEQYHLDNVQKVTLLEAHQQEMFRIIQQIRQEQKRVELKE